MKAQIFETLFSLSDSFVAEQRANLLSTWKLSRQVRTTWWTLVERPLNSTAADRFL